MSCNAPVLLLTTMQNFNKIVNKQGMNNFWDKLEKPFFVLAPLANVTDAAFRSIIAKYSKPAGPHVFWTEFVSADGLVLATDER